jgi:hypothetical protein
MGIRLQVKAKFDIIGGMSARRRPKPRYLLVSILFAVVILIVIKILLDYRSYRRTEMEERLREMRMSVRVEVLNGTEVSGLAARVGNHLRELGFDVVSVENAGGIMEETVIVERADASLGNARLLSEEIGCDCITSELDPDRLLEVSLVLGNDYSRYFGEQDE